MGTIRMTEVVRARVTADLKEAIARKARVMCIRPSDLVRFVLAEAVTSQEHQLGDGSRREARE